MKQQRLLLSLLLSIVITFYGVSYLSFQGEFSQVAFSVAWSFFAFLAVSGNLVGLLYGKKTKKRGNRNLANIQRQKMREFV